MLTSLGRKSILIIDDSETVRQQVRDTLQGAGYDVFEACDGQAGMEAIDSGPSPALVICDVNMPRMNGLRFLEACQASSRAQSLPVIMLTNARCPEEIGKAKRLGARGWIVKPCDPERLVATVEWIAGKPD